MIGHRILRSLLPAMTIAAVFHSPTPARAQMLPATTIPVKEADLTTWIFTKDKAIQLTPEIKGGNVIGHFDAYSLADVKLAWHADQSLGQASLDVGPRMILDASESSWFLGTGPLTRFDLSSGTVRWSIPCAQSGFINPSSLKFLPGDRILTMGAKKCNHDSAFDAMKEPSFSMIDATSGKVLWSYQTKSLEYEMALGYWARVAQYQGKRVQKDKRIQIESMFGSATSGDFDVDGGKADRLVISGESFEAVSLADGSPLFKTKDKVGILRGAFGGKVFFHDGDEVTAYSSGNGSAAWTFDLKEKGAVIYTRDDLLDQGHAVPADLTDIMISEHDIVSRVSVDTGKTLYTLKRDGSNWQGSIHGVLVKGSDKTIAYDWNTGGKLWESKIGGRPKGYDAGDYIVFIDGKEMVEGKPIAPFELTVANGKTGQIMWTKNDKKITAFDFIIPGQIRLQSEKGAVSVNIADGKPAPASDAGSAYRLLTFEEKGVQCRDWEGKLVWERKGEKYAVPEHQPKNGLAIWVTADGGVEVIAMADGATKWKGKTAKETEVYVDDTWSTLVVPNKKEVTFVKLKP